MRKKWLKTALAAVTAAALTMSFGTAAVMAEESEASDVIDVMDDLGLDIPEGGSITSEISVSGALSALGDSEIQADILAVVDSDAAAQSMTGSVTISGMTLSFGEYFDADALVLQIPMLPKALSYNYNADPEGTILAEMLGTSKPLDTINKYLLLIYKALSQDPACEAYAEELAEVFSSFAGSLEFGLADEKEVIVGDGTETASGMNAVITADAAADLANDLLAVTLPNGQTMEEYINAMADLGNYMNGDVEGGADISAIIADYLVDMPDMTATLYLDSDSNPREISLSAEDSAIALQFRGAEIPYTDIAFAVDGEAIASAKVDITETGAEIALIVSDSEVAKISVDTSAGTFSVESEYLPETITGTISFDGDDMVLATDFMGLHIETRTYQGGEVTKPEGEALELTTMSAEDFQDIFSSISSLFGGAFDEAA